MNPYIAMVQEWLGILWLACECGRRISRSTLSKSVNTEFIYSIAPYSSFMLGGSENSFCHYRTYRLVSAVLHGLLVATGLMVRRTPRGGFLERQATGTRTDPLFNIFDNWRALTGSGDGGRVRSS